MTDMEKQARIGRQAMNIQVRELVFQSVNSDGKPIEGTERTVSLIYNLENISTKEVDELVDNGMYVFDDRIIKTDPVRLAHIFPHRGEAKRMGGVSYWKSRAYANDMTNCECSSCGFTLPAYMAVEYGSSSTEYAGVAYRFCPKCGAVMSHKPNEEEGK